MLPFQATPSLKTRNLGVVKLLRNNDPVANETIAHDDGTVAKLPRLPPRGSQRGMHWGPARLTSSDHFSSNDFDDE